MDLYDVIIIGAGPAGLTAAIYTSRSRLKTLLIESFTVPGQAVVTSDIENYPGFPEGLNGFELIDKFKKQAGKFGAMFKVGDVKEIKKRKLEDEDVWEINLNEESILGSSVILAMGAHPKKLDVPGEEALIGKGVSYCAVCDAAFFKNKKIAVIGGGNTAIEEALFLTKFADKVTVIHRRNKLRAAEILQERAFADKKIEFIWDSIVESIQGQEKIGSLRLKNVKTNEENTFDCDGVFVFVGYEPNTGFIKDTIRLDENGYVIADENMSTSKPGIFACGDVRKKLLRQIVTACGDGAIAAVSARMYLQHLKEGLPKK